MSIFSKELHWTDDDGEDGEGSCEASGSGLLPYLNLMSSVDQLQENLWEKRMQSMKERKRSKRTNYGRCQEKTEAERRLGSELLAQINLQFQCERSKNERGKGIPQEVSRPLTSIWKYTYSLSRKRGNASGAVIQVWFHWLLWPTVHPIAVENPGRATGSRQWPMLRWRRRVDERCDVRVGVPSFLLEFVSFVQQWL